MRKCMHTITIDTENTEGRIIQRIYEHEFSFTSHAKMTYILDLKEESTKKILKSLGWSSPEETGKLIARVDELEFKLKCCV